MKITASRLSDGNKVFPAEIHVEPTGITIKIPGLFRGDSKYFDFHNIASVDVNTPMVGFSTITIYAGGTKMTAHGFAKSEVKAVKAAIENGKLKMSSTSNNMSTSNNTPSPKPSFDGFIARHLGLDDASMEHKRNTEEERREKTKEDLKNAAATASKFIGGLMSSGDRKKAHLLHQDLIKITDDIDIAIAMNNKEEALTHIKKLQHTSTHKIPDTDVNYADYWNNKRKEYIGKFSS